MAYFIATVKVKTENERGRLTSNNEVYCVESETCTEAEAKVVKEFFDSLKVNNGGHQV